jgi:hypothetical protein
MGACSLPLPQSAEALSQPKASKNKPFCFPKPGVPSGTPFFCADSLVRVKQFVEPIGIQMAPHYLNGDGDKPKDSAAALAGNARLFAGFA